MQIPTSYGLMSLMLSPDQITGVSAKLKSHSDGATNPLVSEEISAKMPSAPPRRARHEIKSPCDREPFALTTHLRTQPTLCGQLFQSEPTPKPFSPDVFLRSEILLIKESTLKLTNAEPQKCPWPQEARRLEGFILTLAQLNCTLASVTWVQTPALAFPTSVNLDKFLSLSGPRVPRL